jgi:hypothetical protein
MDIPDYLKDEIVLPPRYRQHPLRLRFFDKTPLAKASRTDIATGVAPDAAAEFILPKIPPLPRGHPLQLFYIFSAGCQIRRCRPGFTKKDVIFLGGGAFTAKTVIEKNLFGGEDSFFTVKPDCYFVPFPDNIIQLISVFTRDKLYLA